MTKEVTPFKQETLNAVFQQVSNLEKVGGINIPEDYSAANALQAAWFKLSEIKKIKDKWISLAEYCTKESIASALFEMVSQGLNPAKNQCAFVPYGTTCTLVREYQGSIALAKRYGGLKNVIAREIYKGDKLVTLVDTKGVKQLVSHDQPLSNMDNEIIGAYCVVEHEDGTTSLTEMTRKKIEAAWSQGTNGTKVHNKFTDEMCKKTVTNRACKPYINSSNDEVLMNREESSEKQIETLSIETENKELPEQKENPISANLEDAVVIPEEAAVVPESEKKKEVKPASGPNF